MILINIYIRIVCAYLYLTKRLRARRGSVQTDFFFFNLVWPTIFWPIANSMFDISFSKNTVYYFLSLSFFCLYLYQCQNSYFLKQYKITARFIRDYIDTKKHGTRKSYIVKLSKSRKLKNKQDS